jgi:hypothetical protein
MIFGGHSSWPTEDHVSRLGISWLWYSIIAKLIIYFATTLCETLSFLSQSFISLTDIIMHLIYCNCGNALNANLWYTTEMFCYVHRIFVLWSKHGLFLLRSNEKCPHIRIGPAVLHQELFSLSSLWLSHN